jgi:exopolyphosphatase/pppGpp-phosphohydrolase
MRMDRRGEPLCIKFHALGRWASRHLGRIDHEKRVAANAHALFELTGPLHRLNGEDLRLLRMAALVHDVGRSVDRESHPSRGARMLFDHDDLPLTGAERRALAFLTRYHKGRVPPVGRDNILRRRDNHDRLRMLLAILRVADALDGRATETPRLRFNLRGRQLQITCHLERNTSKARRVYTRRKKFRLLEKMLGCRVQVGLSRPKTVRLVA